ncbi:MAG: T9SS type A sorting domain-containing protein [Saprospiraceae bacterium]|nr:T9SS type A sorting domain-containing protein [Saprospiraceae bacterium]
MKKLLLSFCLISHYVSAQVTFNVQSNFGYPFCFLRSVVPTDSCYYVTGIVQDSTNAIGTIFLKFDLNGDSLLSNKLINPNKWYGAWFGDMLQTDDGHLLEIGQVADSLQKGGIFKFKTSGDTLFVKEYLSPHPDNLIFAPYQIVKSATGKYHILNAVESADYNNQLVLSFLDTGLNVDFHKTYGIPQKDELPGALLADDDGGIIVGANRDNTNTNLKNFTSNTYIFKVDSLGNVLWEYLSPNGQLRDIAYSMVKTSDGGLVVASGKGIEHSINASVSQLRWHSYIFKLNANHQQVWGRELRGVRHTGGTGLAKVVTATDGAGFVACGNLLEDKSFGEPKYGSWVFKVSNQGDSLWARYFTFVEGVDRYYEPVDLKATPDGGYVIVGQSLENLGWLMKLDSFGCLIPGCNANDGPNATTEKKVEMTLAIYPNPTSDFLNFELRSPILPQRASFRIVDANGKVVKQLQSDSPRDTFIVPVREWAAGVYFLQLIEHREVIHSEKFIKN